MIKCNKGNEIITFKYDTRGSRTNKTITKDNNIISINYILDNKLIKEERSNGISLIYLNSDNDIIGFVYNNEYYIYHKNISGLKSMFNRVDALLSFDCGAFDGLLSLLGSPQFENFQSKLSKFSKWMLGIGLGLDIISSAINNYYNDSLTTEQKWASFFVDTGYYFVTTGITYTVGSLLVSSSVALGTAAGCTAITYLGASFLGFSIIAGGIVVVAVVGGTILIANLLYDLNIWLEKKKEEWFN